MGTEAGSYDYSSLEVDSTELTRLRLQAQVVKGLEIKGLTDHGLTEGMDVLDIGCGPGFITQIIADLAGTGAVTGIDLNDDLLEVANKELDRSTHPNLTFKKGNIYELGTLGQKFDFVYSRFVFQHLEHPQRAVEQIFQVLKPGGRLMVIDVDDAWVSLYPENDTFETIVTRQREHQKGVGGDRYIGRKLFNMFRNAGLDKMQVEAVTLSSVMLGMENFLDLTTGYKVVFLNDTDASISQDMVDEMKRDCGDGNHLGLVAILATSGCRPS
jgi:protein-L-isoaspartate O-methyltransferase